MHRCCSLTNFSLQSDIKAKKADLSKQTKTVQTLQREVQIAKLELGEPTILLRR